MVLAEVDYWRHKPDLGAAWLVFLEDVEAGIWRVEWPTAGDLRRARQLQVTYADSALGVVDASVIALVERLLEPKVATLDRRHFSFVRPAHIPALRLLPE